MMAVIPFIFKAFCSGILTLSWLRGVGKIDRVYSIVALFIFLIFINTLPHGFIDIKSGDFIESGSLLFLLMLYLLQSLIQHMQKGRRFDIQLDLLLLLTLLSPIARYGSFDLAEIASRQKNLINFAIPQIGLIYDPVNALIFFWICLVKFRDLRDSRNITGPSSFDLLQKLQILSLMLIGLYIFLGGTPTTHEFNIPSTYNALIQTIASSLYIYFYIALGNYLFKGLCNLYYPMSPRDLERDVWLKIIPISLAATILSHAIFIFSGGRF